MYRWYTPLLHLDTHVKLVQYIKLASAECGYGTELPARRGCRWWATSGSRCWSIIRNAIATRPR